MAEKNNQRILLPSWGGVYPRREFKHVFVVGLAGFAGSGKTTVAEQIISDLGQDKGMPDGVRFSFARRLKEVLATLVGEPGMTFNQPEDKTARIYGDSDWDARKFLMLFATEFCRDQIGANLWLDIIVKQIHQLKKPTVAIIDDLRFSNELKMVESLGQAFLLRRSGIGRPAAHRSEQPDQLAIKTIIDIDADTTPRRVAQSVLETIQEHEFWPPAASS